MADAQPPAENRGPAPAAPRSLRFHPGDATRLSDSERHAVVDALGRAVGDGRLDVIGFDERVSLVYTARTRGELAAVTSDLFVVGAPEERLYTESEVLAAREIGRRPRLGILVGGTTLGLLAPVLLGSSAWAVPALVFASLFILLYVAKAGPARWYAPSARALERERHRAARAEHRIRKLERREERSAAVHEWTRRIDDGARGALEAARRRRGGPGAPSDDPR